MPVDLSHVWSQASWREATRLGAPAIGLEHLYLGLLGIGGAAARLLGSHGISLASARAGVRAAGPQPEAVLPATALGPIDPPHDLREDPDTGYTPTAAAVHDRAARSPDTYGLLVALLTEDSGVVRRLVAADGVIPQDLAAPLRAGSEDPFIPDSVPADADLLPPPASAQRVRHFVSAPVGVVADAIADPDHLSWWAHGILPETPPAAGDVVRLRRGTAALTLRLHHTRRATASGTVVTWIHEALDGPHAGEPVAYDRFDLQPAPGGTELVRTTGRRTFGPLATLLAPAARRLGAVRLLRTTQAIAFGAAEG